MSGLRFLLLLAPLMLPGRALAAVDAADIPADAVWYLHVDLEELRSAASGKLLYRWLDDEVFADILSHLGGFAEYVTVPGRGLCKRPLRDRRSSRSAPGRVRAAGAAASAA